MSRLGQEIAVAVVMAFIALGSYEWFSWQLHDHVAAAVMAIVLILTPVARASRGTGT